MHGVFVVEDKLSMAHSLETRVPLLDNDLVDFALTLPVSYKLLKRKESFKIDEDEALKKYQLKSKEGKVILRKAMERLIPKEIINREKIGFSAPDASWFKGESIDYIKGLLLDKRARIYDYLNFNFVKSKLEEHFAGKKNHRLFIWSLLSFEWWLRRFLG